MRDKNKYNYNINKESKGGEESQKAVDSHEPVQAKHLEVRVYNNNFDKAMRLFRALVQKERVLSTYKEKQSYEKPSQKKRRKRNEMKRKMMERDAKAARELEEKTPHKSKFEN